MIDASNEDTITSKERIFQAAVSLFAQKGFNAVSTREIVKKAGVNIAMIKYYFGGKIGILKAIINEAYEKHHQAITGVEEHLSSRDHVRVVIKNFIAFFRVNTELAIVAFDVIPYDIPEILELKEKWRHTKRELLKRLFDKLGLDIHNSVHVSLFNGFLGNMVLNHFLSCYYWERTTHQQITRFDDEFYEQYTESLTDFYMAGVKGLLEQNKRRMNS